MVTKSVEGLLLVSSLFVAVAALSGLGLPAVAQNAISDVEECLCTHTRIDSANAHSVAKVRPPMPGARRC